MNRSCGAFHKCREPILIHRYSSKACKGNTSGKRVLLRGQNDVFGNPNVPTHPRATQFILISDVDILHSHLKIVDDFGHE